MHYCVWALLPHWWSHSLTLIRICHFLTSHSGADDEKWKEKGRDEDDRLSSLESTSRWLHVHDWISLKVWVKWRELEGGGRPRLIEWVAEISYVSIQLSLAVLIVNFISNEYNEPLTICRISSGTRDCVNCSLDLTQPFFNHGVYMHVYVFLHVRIDYSHVSCQHSWANSRVMSFSL